LLSLPEQKLQEIEDLLNSSDFNLWSPQEGPQLDAYFSPADILFYGGAAGGGKTDLALGLAITAHQKSLIIRRTYPQLAGIEQRSEQIYGTTKGYNSQKRIWKRDNRIIELGHCQHEKDRKNYQGRDHDLKVFDEITQFTETMFRYISNWNRSADPNQRSRVLLTGNPPERKEGLWVIQFFGPWIDKSNPRYPFPPGKLLWYAMLDGEEREFETGEDIVSDDGRVIKKRSRTFIPAKVTDNKYYMATGYDAVLQSLPEPLRSQLYEGRFDVEYQDDPYQVIPTAWFDAAVSRWEENAPKDERLDAIGCDVARGGKDNTVVFKRHGFWIDKPTKVPGKLTPKGNEVAALCIDAVGDNENVMINIDVDGVGASAYDILYSLDYMIYGIHHSGASKARTRNGNLGFHNLRAEIYWNLRDLLDPNNNDAEYELEIPPDPDLRRQILAITWEPTIRGIKIRSKDEIIQELGESPDLADALVYVCYYNKIDIFMSA